MTQSLYVVVGTGAIARRHSRLLRAVGFDVIHVRRFSSNAETVFDGVPVLRSLEEAIDRRPVACIVATAAPDHTDAAAQVLRQGIDVLVEKPLAQTAAAARELIDVAAQSHSIAMVGYCLRFRQGLARLRHEAHARAIGRLLGLRASVGQYLPDWRPGNDYRDGVSAQKSLGGGALLELSHEVDLALWILGNAVSVAARATKRSELEIDVEDTADLLIEHESGAVSNVHLDMTDPAANRAIRLVGSEGTLEWNQESGGLRIFRKSSGWTELENEANSGAAAMYEAQLRYFEECRARRNPPSPSLEDGDRVLRTIDAARRSEASGRRESV